MRILLAITMEAGPCPEERFMSMGNVGNASKNQGVARMLWPAREGIVTLRAQ